MDKVKSEKMWMTWNTKEKFFYPEWSAKLKKNCIELFQREAFQPELWVAVKVEIKEVE